MCTYNQVLLSLPVSHLLPPFHSLVTILAQDIIISHLKYCKNHLAQPPWSNFFTVISVGLVIKKSNLTMSLSFLEMVQSLWVAFKN